MPQAENDQKNDFDDFEEMKQSVGDSMLSQKENEANKDEL